MLFVIGDGSVRALPCALRLHLGAQRVRDAASRSSAIGTRQGGCVPASLDTLVRPPTFVGPYDPFSASRDLYPHARRLPITSSTTNHNDDWACFTASPVRAPRCAGAPSDSHPRGDRRSAGSVIAPASRVAAAGFPLPLPASATAPGYRSGSATHGGRDGNTHACSSSSNARLAGSIAGRRRHRLLIL